MPERLEPERLEDAAIHHDDQEEIRKEIERVAAENRIAVDDNTFAVQPARKGYTLPLLVNVGAVLLGAGLLIGIAAFFRSEEQQVRAETQFAASAQGRIVQELRREAEEALEEKDRRIREIEAQLAQVRSDRAALAADIDERVRQRELELEAQFERELAAERERLAEEGLSEDEIEAIIARIRAERIAEIEREIAEYRASLEEQLAEAEADLDRQEARYSEQLAEATEERSAILAEAEARESRLRAEFEGRIAERERELGEVEQELLELTRRRDREQAAVREITGFFDAIRTRISTGELGEAEQLIVEMRSFLNDPSLAELRPVAERRQADLNLLAALEQLIEVRRENDALQETARTGERLAAFEELVREADALREEGARDAAIALYREAVSTVAAVSRSHRYLVERALAEEDERYAALNAQLTELEREREGLIDERDALAAALEEREADLAALGAAEDEARIVELEAEIDSLVAAHEEELASVRAQAEAEIAALEAQLEADAEVTGDAPPEEIEALEAQHARRVAALEQEHSRRVATLEAEVASLEREHSRRVAALEAEIAELEEELAERERRLANLGEEEGPLAAEIASLEQQLRETESEFTTREDALLDEIAELSEMRDRLAALQSAYADYIDAEPDDWDGDDELAIGAARVEFDSFLNRDATQEVLPAIDVRVNRFFEAFERSGRERVLMESADLLFELALIDSVDARVERVREELNAHQDDEGMSEFLEELVFLIDGGV